MSMTTAQSTTKRKIQSALRRWKGGLDADLLPLFRDFVKETLERLRGPFLAHYPPKQILQYLEEGFLFALERSGNEPKVQLVERSNKGIGVFSSMKDQPFIVDTVRLFLKNHRANYWGGFNLVFRASRDESGRLVAIGEDDAAVESLLFHEADRGEIHGNHEAALAELKRALKLSQAMVADFRPMTRACERLAERCEVVAEREPDHADAMRETAAFLQWLLRENFVFMGAHDGATALGFQRLEDEDGVTHPADGEWASPHEPGTVRVRKSQMESPVHRAGRVDEILVTIHDNGAAHTLFLRGMFTYRAVTQPSRNVPILRRVLANILGQQESAPGSYRYKGLANVFDSLPTEFLFTATQDAIGDMVDLVFESEQQQEVGATFLVIGADRAFCLVAMPKAQYSDTLRRELQSDIVGRLNATYCDHGIFVSRYEVVLLHFYITGAQFPKNTEIQDITEQIRNRATPWAARLWNALAEEFGETEADRLAETYARAFPLEWTAARDTGNAVAAIQKLEQLQGTSNVLARLFIDPSHGNPVLELYQAEDVNLTDILPVLDNFGLVVHSDSAVRVNCPGGALHIDTLRLEGAKGLTVDELMARSELLCEALEAVFSEQVQNDRLNAMVLRSELGWAMVDVLRGYANYARQLRLNVSATRLQDILLTHPITCHRLADLFQARFDPDVGRSRTRQIRGARESVQDELRLINSHDEHLVFTALTNLIDSTLRTNHYRNDRIRHYLSFKLDCAQVKGMGPGRPMFEIYVHNLDVEGVHLRFGMVARGGLRWSDRDDYRTEILGLATTQQVKNTVIVPSGAKGGFYLKRPAEDRGERRKQADELYKLFIRGLLDITDNSVDGQIVAPDRVVRHDGDDAYLVVAADKGTAHLSDTANGISRAYSFWLDDAFASGGSNGYDHKKVGITARGAWKLVNRHFAERGVNPYEQPFTAVGIGDMGGDVFGNGLLETDQVQLKAAFNHLHIFLDPNPDAATSYAERKRLFACQGGWDQYDTSLVSQGGGVFNRRHKSVPLSPEVQAMLGLEQDEAAPETVMNAILKMEVDLLWNGGIGTYVKATDETHRDADDRSNDALRVSASELRCRIIGEGGNLGMTQDGRIEAGLMGIGVNTDAIDNSGGVDMSDHEVNLKILLQQVVSRGDLTEDARNTMLEEMTEEVAELVFLNNDSNGRQLSRDVLRSKSDIWQFGRAISFIERVFGVDRELLNLPAHDELARRADTNAGLTRPELAVLGAWVKMYVFNELMASNPKDLPGYDEFLTQYFPERIQKHYADDIRSHMLADEIAITCATTRIVSDSGAAFVAGVVETTGASVMELASAYLKAQFLARAHVVRRELEALRASVALEPLNRAWIRVDAGARDVARYWLSTQGRIPTDDELAEMSGATSTLYDLQASEVAKRNRASIAALTDSGLTEQTAQRVLKSEYLNDTLMVWAEARETNMPFPEMVVRHLSVARAGRLQEVLDDLARRPATGRWDPIAMRILYNRFHNLLRRAVVTCPVEDANATVDELEPQLTRGPLEELRAHLDRLLDEQPDGQRPSVATLLVMEERLGLALRRLSEKA